MLMANTARAQETPSRLRWTTPDGWTPSIDGRTLFPPGGGAAVTFAPSAPFAGTAEQWATESWRTLAQTFQVVSGPTKGRQGEFTTQTGVFRQANGTTLALSLYTLVSSGRGESFAFVTEGGAPFRGHIAAVSRLVQSISVAPVPGAAPAPAAAAATAPSTAAPAPAAPRGPAIAGGDEIAGLYLATTRQFRISPFGSPGSGSWETATEFYLLSRDGRVFRGPDLPKAPGGDLSRFDYDAARREAPHASGTYSVRGREVVLQMGDPKEAPIVATRPEPDVLEIRQTKYKRSGRPSPPPAPAVKSTP